MTTFAKAFAAARKAQGPGKTFEWKGKKYTTDTAADQKGPTRPKARPTSETPSATPNVTRRGGADPRPKATGGTTTSTPNVTRRGGAAPAGTTTKPAPAAKVAAKPPVAPKSVTPASANTRKQNKAAGLPVSPLGRAIAKVKAALKSPASRGKVAQAGKKRN